MRWVLAPAAAAMTLSQIGEGERQGLLDKNVLAVRQCHDRLLGVKFVRRSDVDRLHRRVRAQRAEIDVGLGVENAREGRARALERIGAGMER